MTEQHPLTDEMIDEIFANRQWWQSPDNVACLRAAADWQLERDVEFFKKFLVDALRISRDTAELMVQEFKKAMRPQQQEDNQ